MSKYTMRHDVEMWHPQKLVYIAFTGQVTREGLVAYLETLRQVSSIAEDYSFISDQRQLDVSQLSPKDIDWLVQEVAMRRGWYQKSKHCLLVASPLAFGLARMFELQAQGLAIHEIGVASSWQACQKWLHLDPAVPDPALHLRSEVLRALASS